MADGGSIGLTSLTFAHFPAGLTGFLSEISSDQIKVTVKVSNSNQVEPNCEFV